MYRPRIICVLLLRQNVLYKSIKFKSHKYVGDPINAVKIFNDKEADELIFLDISAGAERRQPDLNLIQRIAEEANMPFSVGGGIEDLQTIKSIIRIGAERVVIRSAALKNPNFIKMASDTFAQSSVSVCIDVRTNFFGKKVLVGNVERKYLRYSPQDFARVMEEAGAGEVVVQSVDRDGTMEGYDVELLRTISGSVTIPVIALGGASNLENMKTTWQETNVNGLAAASMFLYQGRKKGLLINYPSRETIQSIFTQKTKNEYNRI